MTKIDDRAELDGAHKDLDYAITILKRVADTAERMGYACCNANMVEGRDKMGACAGYLHDAIGAAMKARSVAGQAELPGGITPKSGGKG